MEPLDVSPEFVLVIDSVAVLSLPRFFPYFFSLNVLWLQLFPSLCLSSLFCFAFQYCKEKFVFCRFTSEFLCSLAHWLQFSHHGFFGYNLRGSVVPRFLVFFSSFVLRHTGIIFLINLLICFAFAMIFVQYGEVLTPFVADKTITHLGSEHPTGEQGIHDRCVT